MRVRSKCFGEGSKGVAREKKLLQGNNIEWKKKIRKKRLI